MALVPVSQQKTQRYLWIAGPWRKSLCVSFRVKTEPCSRTIMAEGHCDPVTAIARFFGRFRTETRTHIAVRELPLQR
jgi:hypothetical protein